MTKRTKRNTMLTEMKDAIVNNRIKSVLKLMNEDLVNAREAIVDDLNSIEVAAYEKKSTIVKGLSKFYNKRELSKLMHVSAALNDVNTLRILIDIGLNVNFKDETGRTALHWAAQENAVRAGKILIDHQVSVDALDNEKFSPLSVAVGEGHKKFADFLLKNGANPNKKIVGGTALHTACSWNRKDIAELLIKTGVKINTRDGEGRTALHFAVLYGHEDIIRLLLRHGIKVDVKDHKGLTALDLASGRGTSIKRLWTQRRQIN